MTITSAGHGKEKVALMTLRTGIPARSVETLARTLGNPAEIQRVVGLDKK